MNMRTEVSGSPARQVSDLWFLEQFDRWVESEPDRFALGVDHPDRAEEYTYRDVSENSVKVARALAGSGVKPGDRVGILMDNSPHWVFAILGILRLGAVGVPLSTLLPADSVRRLIAHAECRQVFTDSSNVEIGLEALASLDRHEVRLIANAPATDGAVSWDEFLASGEGQEWSPAASPDGTAVLVYTSGTTGDPKGVMISTRGLSHDIDGIVRLTELDSNQRILSVLPFSHVLPLVANGLGPLAIGCSVVFLPTITPQGIIEAFKR